MKSADGKIERIRVEAITEWPTKLKGFIHWVSHEESEEAIVRVYSYLFTAEEVGDEWLNQLNPNSLVEKPNARIWKSLSKSAVFDRF